VFFPIAFDTTPGSLQEQDNSRNHSTCIAPISFVHSVRSQACSGCMCMLYWRSARVPVARDTEQPPADTAQLRPVCMYSSWSCDGCEPNNSEEESGLTHSLELRRRNPNPRHVCTRTCVFAYTCIATQTSLYMQPCVYPPNLAMFECAVYMHVFN